MDQRVWYAAYGSNLNRQRFEVYLTGGSIPGATDREHQTGARDPSPPIDDRPISIAHTLYFALRSHRWGGGGVAFLDPAENPDRPTLGRAWNVSLGQLADVYRQENRSTEGFEIDLEQLESRRSLDLLGSNYGRLLYLGRLEKLPVLTFTTAQRHVKTNPAHNSYLEVIKRGLVECWTLGVEEMDTYLGAANERSRAE